MTEKWVEIQGKLDKLQFKLARSSSSIYQVQVIKVIQRHDKLLLIMRRDFVDH